MLSRVWRPAIVAGIIGCGKLVVDASNKLVVDATPKQKMIQLILVSFPGSDRASFGDFSSSFNEIT